MGTGIQSFCYPENAYYVLTPYQPIARFIDSNAMFLVSWRDLQTEASAAQSGHTHPAVLSGNCPGGVCTVWREGSQEAARVGRGRRARSRRGSIYVRLQGGSTFARFAALQLAVRT